MFYKTTLSSLLLVGGLYSFAPGQAPEETRPPTVIARQVIEAAVLPNGDIDIEALRRATMSQLPMPTDDPGTSEPSTAPERRFLGQLEWLWSWQPGWLDSMVEEPTIDPQASRSRAMAFSQAGGAGTQQVSVSNVNGQIRIDATLITSEGLQRVRLAGTRVEVNEQIDVLPPDLRQQLRRNIRF